jgi:hypothetical protein
MNPTQTISLYTVCKFASTIVVVCLVSFSTFARSEKDSLKVRRNGIFIEAGQVLNPAYSIFKVSLIPYTIIGFKQSSFAIAYGLGYERLLKDNWSIRLRCQSAINSFHRSYDTTYTFENTPNGFDHRKASETLKRQQFSFALGIYKGVTFARSFNINFGFDLLYTMYSSEKYTYNYNRYFYSPQVSLFHTEISTASLSPHWSMALAPLLNLKYNFSSRFSIIAEIQFAFLYSSILSTRQGFYRILTEYDLNNDGQIDVTTASSQSENMSSIHLKTISISNALPNIKLSYRF